MFASAMRPKTGRPVLLIPPDLICPNPSQPRRHFDEHELRSMAESIRANGIIQPLTVRRAEGNRFELISGERRLRAARIAGIFRVPCLLMEADDKKAAIIALLENLQRRDLSCFEEAEGLHRLIHEWGVTQEEAAQRLGKAQSTLSNKIRLLKLGDWERERIEAAGLTERHARALLRVEEEEKRRELLDRIIAHGLTVLESERLIDDETQPEPPTPSSTVARKKSIVKDYRLLTNTITHAVDTMRRCGVSASAVKCETDSYIEYTIRIPKRPNAPIGSQG